jgi:tripartite-type tricarboxylate transporter receptor subunit TctC
MRALMIAAALAATCAHADYPERPIRFIMPYPAGGSIDFGGRTVAARLAENLGQQIVVDNRTGSGGTIGTETAARAAPDGYTIVMGGVGTLAISPNLQRKLPYDPLKDFAPITMLASTPYVLVLHPSVAAASVRELVALAKARPGQMTYASGGNGSAPHLAGEYFKSLAGLDILHVPYKGSTPAITDLIAGQVQMLFTGIPPVLAHIKSGRLRAIAVTSAQRAAAMPELPTLRESGLREFEVSPWFGVLAPARTPAALIGRLNREMVAILQTSAIRQRFSTEGIEVVGDTPAHFAEYIQHELVKWSRVIRAAGIRAD